MFLPHSHGRVQVQIMGEEVGGFLEPPRYRPLPNSPVFPLDLEETKTQLKLHGDINLGLAIGFEEDMNVLIPSNKKSVLPRHLGILGTTGGGKTTTVSSTVDQFSKANVATIIIDTEGEYTHLDRPTDNEQMRHLLKKRGLQAGGIKNFQVYHLVNRETTAEKPTPINQFKLEFSSISPHVALDILGLSPAQEDRFLKAYDVTDVTPF